MPSDLFFYGTLCHMPLLQIVLGQGRSIDVVPAQLADHRADWVAHQTFPMISAEPGAQAIGLLVRGLTPQDVARLNFYEGEFAYDLTPMTVKTAQGPVLAQVYVPRAGVWTRGAPWVLAEWQAQWGDTVTLAAEEMMDRYNSAVADEAQALYPFFLSRAWARNLARTPAPQTLRRANDSSDVEFLAQRPGFDGFFRVKAFEARFRRFDGNWSAPVQREAFVAFDAALVLPYDPVADRVLLIEQLRFGPIHRGDPAPWVLEPIAGLVDAGEDPADCARREAVEEAGLMLEDLRPMVGVYASPGYTTEFFHCFLGVCDLSAVTTSIGGLASENEDIRRHVISFDHAMALIDSGEINAGPLVMMLLWLSNRREALRASA